MNVLLMLLMLGAPIVRDTAAPRRPQPDACASDSAHVADHLIALETVWLQTPTRAALDSILGPDFVHPVASGDFLNKTEHIAWTISHPRPPAHRELGGLRVRRYGEIGIVTGMVASRRAGGAVQRTVFTDVFRCRDGRWQAVSAQETLVANSH